MKDETKNLVYAFLIISFVIVQTLLWAHNKRPVSVTEKTVYCHDVCIGSIPDWQGIYKKQCIGKLILDDCLPIR